MSNNRRRLSSIFEILTDWQATRELSRRSGLTDSCPLKACLQA